MKDMDVSRLATSIITTGIMAAGLGVLPMMASAETLSLGAQIDGYTVSRIDQCGQQVSVLSDREIAVFGQEVDISKLRGWNHIASKSPGSEFEGVQLNPERYDFNRDYYQANADCSGLRTYNTVLVKKLADWDHQHANGLERRVYDDRLGVENLGVVSLELKVHRVDSNLPTMKEIGQNYGQYLSQSELLELDRGEINFAVTLYEAGANNQLYPSLNATKFIRLPVEFMDQWLRIEIPVDSFDFYMEENYIPTPVNEADYADYTFIGLRLNPENHTGDVLRNFLDGELPQDAKELFKEYHLSLKRITLSVKDSSKIY